MAKPTTITVSAKCSDLCWMRLNGEKGENLGEHDGYVPTWFPNPKEEHYGDYVQLEIDLATGQILNWKKPSKASLDETFKPVENEEHQI